MKQKFKALDGLFLLSFFALIFFNHWLFSHFWQIQHWEWYLANGAAISWLMSLLALIWGDLNRNIWFISARPGEYAVGYFRLLAVVFNALAPPKKSQRKTEGPVTFYKSDIPIGSVIMFVFMAFLIAWLVVIVPIQYFVFFVAGAPARLMLYSKERPIARIDEAGQLAIDSVEADKDIPRGWWDASITRNPVSITSGFAGMILWLVKMLVI